MCVGSAWGGRGCAAGTRGIPLQLLQAGWGFLGTGFSPPFLSCFGFFRASGCSRSLGCAGSRPRVPPPPKLRPPGTAGSSSVNATIPRPFRIQAMLCCSARRYDRLFAPYGAAWPPSASALRFLFHAARCGGRTGSKVNPRCRLFYTSRTGLRTFHFNEYGIAPNTQQPSGLLVLRTSVNPPAGPCTHIARVIFCPLATARRPRFSLRSFDHSFFGSPRRHIAESAFALILTFFLLVIPFSHGFGNFVTGALSVQCWVGHAHSLQLQFRSWELIAMSRSAYFFSTCRSCKRSSIWRWHCLLPSCLHRSGSTFTLTSVSFQGSAVVFLSLIAGEFLFCSLSAVA